MASPDSLPRSRPLIPVVAGSARSARCGCWWSVLIERHGGRLAIYSVPRVGTTVRLSFPAARVMQAALDRGAAVGDAPG